MSAAGVEAVAHALAGSTGGVFAMTLLYPLENIRTRLQVQVSLRKASQQFNSNPSNTILNSINARKSEEHIQQETPSKDSKETALNLVSPVNSTNTSSSPTNISSSPSSSSSSTSAPSISSSNTNDEYDGTFDCIRKVCAREGWSHLYSGLSSALVGVGCSSAVYFFWYYLFKKYFLLTSGKQVIGPIENLLVASVAGVVNVFITLPIWVINTRMTLAKKGEEYQGMIDAVRKIHKSEGFAGLYKGLIPSLILVSNPAIQFVVYEQMIHLFQRIRKANIITAAAATAVTAAAAAADGEDDATPKPSTSLPKTASIRLSSFEYFLLGAFGKAVATVITYPYQVIKSREQANRSKTHISTTALIMDMWKNEGIGSFFKGMNAKMTQTVLNSAFMFAVYEKLVRLFLKLLKAFVLWYTGQTNQAAAVATAAVVSTVTK